MAGFNVVPVAVPIGQARRAQYLYLYATWRACPGAPAGYWGDSFGGMVGGPPNGLPVDRESTGGRAQASGDLPRMPSMTRSWIFC